MTALVVKLVPTTFMVTALDPAVMVCGRTALMLGAPRGSTTVLPQPRKKRPAEIPTLAMTAFDIFKTHL
jgi:hypothetical protein